jgi:hypothetical protein
MQPKNKSCVMTVAYGYLKPPASMVMLGLGVLGIFNTAWGACTNVNIFRPEGAHSNSIALCDFSISSDGAISSTLGDRIYNSGMISGDIGISLAHTCLTAFA